MKYQYIFNDGDEDVVISTNADTLHEHLEIFRRFMHACGYHPPCGQLEFIEEDDVVLSADEYGMLISDSDDEA